MRRIVRLADALAGDAPFAAVALSMLFVGFYEEVLARGLLLQRCRRLFSEVAGPLGAVWLPVLVSSALFGAAHGYQGWLGVAQTGLIGIVLALLTLRWGTLWPAILAHAMLNAGSLTLARSLG
jgi:membrane protease YdiL (CAAX protease family)